MKEKNGKTIIIIMGLVIAALMCFSGYLLYDKINNDSKIVNNSNVLMIIEGKSVEVESETAKVIEYNDYYALYNDNGLKLYDFDTKKISDINIGVEINDSVTFELLHDGFIYNDFKNNNNGYYSIELNTIILKNKYDYLGAIYPSYYYDFEQNVSPIDNYLQADKNNKIYVIDINTQGEVISEVDPNWPAEEEGDYSRQFMYDKGYFVSFNGNGGDKYYGYAIYNDDAVLVAKLKDSEYYRILNYNGTEVEIYTKK